MPGLSRSIRCARTTTAVLALAVVALVVAAPAAGASAPPGDQRAVAAQADAPGCASAKARTTGAKRAVTRARAALRRARTVAAKRKARRRLARAKRTLVRRRAAQAQACAPATPAPQPGGTAPVTPTPPPPAVNQPPQFPEPLNSTMEVQFGYDDAGRLTSATATITALAGAVDPDGDPITYSWSATVGTITGDGLVGTWSLPIELGRPARGTATITASDGKGGTDTHQFGA